MKNKRIQNLKLIFKKFTSWELYEDSIVVLLKFFIRRNPISPFYAFWKTLFVAREWKSFKKYFRKFDHHFWTHHPFVSALGSFMFLILLFVGIFNFAFNRNVEEAKADWWNDSWTYRKSVAIANSGSDVADQYVKVVLDTATLVTAGKMQSDCDDIRVADVNGNALTYFIDGDTEYDCNDSDTAIYVMAQNIPVDGTTLYLYYGNAGAENNEATLGSSWNPALSCRNILEHGDSNGDGDYYITPTGNLADKISVYCDMTNDGGGWNLVFHGLPTEAKYLDTTNESIKLSNDIIFNDIKVEGVNLNFSVITTVTETAQLSDTIPQYYYDVDQATDGDDPRVNFHDLDGNQDVLLTDNYFMYGYGNSYRVFYTCINITDIDHYYIGGYAPSCTPKDSFVSVDVGCEGINDYYCDDARATSPVDSGLGLSLYEYQESKVWLRENDLTLNINQSAGSPATEEIGPGPVGYWSFDEGYGTTTYDGSSGGNDGTITGAVWKDESECLSGKCLYFDGTNSVAIPNPISQDNLEQEWTVNAWVKLKKDSALADEYIFEGLNRGLFLNFGATNKSLLYLNSVSADDYYRYGTTDLKDGEWHFVSFLFRNSDGYREIFIDTKNDSGAGPNKTSIPTGISSTLNLGANAVGFIDEVKIYPYIRTVDQLRQDYNAGLSGVKSAKGTSVSFGGKSDKWMSDGLVSHWKMDEASWNGTADEVIDASGNGNDGVRGGDATTVGGRFGNGGTFNGTGDYVNISSSAKSYESFSAWIKTGNSSEQTIVAGVFDLYNIMMDSGKIIKSSSGGAESLQTVSTFNDDKWHNIVITKIGLSYPDNIKIYVDGEEQALEASTNGRVAGQFLIGARYYSNTYSVFYDGKIDEVRAYDRILPPDEVKKLYEYAPGPVLYLKMDEKVSGDAQTLYDISGNENNGTTSDGTNDTGMNCSILGKYGSACEFDGVDDYVSIKNGAVIENDSYSIEFWINTTETKTGDSIIFSNDNDTDSEIIDTIGTRAGKIAWNYIPAGTYKSQGDVAINDGEWHYVALTSDGGRSNGDVNLYIDGSKITQESSGFYRSGDDVCMGARNYTQTPEVFLNGQLDDFQIYDYARTQKQILEDMNAGSPANKSPVLHLSFDEGQGATAYDKSIYENNGTLTPGAGGTNTTVSAMWDKSGKLSGAMEFDGTDDYLDTVNEFDLDSNNDFTVGFWFNSYDDTTSVQEIIGKRRATANSWSIWYRGSDGRLNFELNGDNILRENAMLFTPINEWHYAVAKYEDSVFSVYLDGESGVSNSYSDVGNFDNSNEVNIGKQSSGASHFDGLLDEMKIWNYALTDDEIKQEYANSGSAMSLGGGSAEADSDGTTVTGSASKYCIPGDTAKCDAPVLELPMDELSGATTKDISGNGNDGAISGATWNPVGKMGSALEFDGNDSVDCGNDSDVDFSTGDFSLEAWINTSTAGVIQSILDKGTGSYIDGYGIDIHSDNKINFITDGDGGSSAKLYLYSSDIINVDTWYHISAVRSNGVKYIFINGIRQTGTQADSRELSDLDRSFMIGKQDVDSSGFFNGKIDNVRVFDYARTSAQIAWDYNRGKPVGHWKMDKGAGTTVYDWSENGNSGTITNMDSSTDWVDGKVGKALNFDGTDEYVDLGNKTEFDISDTITVSSWVKLNDFNAYDTIICKTYNGLSVSTTDYFLGFHSTRRPRFFGGYDLSADDEIELDTWYHIVGVRDNTQHHLYVDGVEVKSANNTNSLRVSTQNLTLGIREYNSALQYPLDGQIDDVQIFNYALTPEQVKNMYNGGAMRFE